MPNNANMYSVEKIKKEITDNFVKKPKNGGIPAEPKKSTPSPVNKYFFEDKNCKSVKYQIFQ